MDLKIRPAEYRDANLLSALASTTFYEAYFESDDGRDLGEYIVESFNADQIKQELKDPYSIFLIAELNGNAVGYAKFRKDTSHENLRYKNSIELQRIYILQAVWGKGIGEKLLEKCLAEARINGYESVWLGVWQHNPRAIKFYNKHGFEKIGKLHFFYGGKTETNFVMEKKV